jgi:patatin-related protein
MVGEGRTGGMDGTAVVKDPEQSDRQQIRLAVVLNGGVSLAVWISGVVQEMHRLVEASRRTEDRAEDGYGALLELLDADARIDVIAGTSAGGLNGGFLALGLVHGCTLTGLRDLWRDKGDLGELLRDPREKKAPSVLRGDYFHEQLAGAYRTVLGKAGSLPAASKEETVDLYLTGTLWAGRESAFADDMGRRIVEVDRDATFHFTSDPRVLGAAPAASGDLRTPKGLADQLAVASRCTSSFPGAFEPLWSRSRTRSGWATAGTRRRGGPTSRRHSSSWTAVCCSTNRSGRPSKRFTVSRLPSRCAASSPTSSPTPGKARHHPLRVPAPVRTPLRGCRTRATCCWVC